MKRSLDPAPFNAIYNHPEVRPWMGHGCEPQDLSVVVENTDNFCFLTPNEDGGYIVAKLHLGLYVAHTLALPSARGRPMLQLMRDGFEYMFTATDAVEIVTTCPDGNPMGDRWAKVAGFRETFRREAFFPLMGKTVGASFRSLAYQDWAIRHEPNRRAGEAFHDQIHAASPHLALHPDDPVHDAMVGATIKGCLAGNIAKSVDLFNRWAVQAGYFPSAIISERPPVIFTGDATISLIDGKLEVLKVQVCETDPNAIS